MAHYDADGTLDKESTSYDDIFDAFRLALKFYRYEDSSGRYDWKFYEDERFYISNFM